MLHAVASAPAVSSSALPVLTTTAQKAASTDPAELLRRWFSGLSPASVRKYRLALRSFADWSIHEQDRSAEADMRLLIAAGPARTHAMLEGWRDELLAAGKAPATVSGLLSALCSLVRQCRRVGLLSWAVERVAPKIERRCDRRGPPVHELERLLAYLDELAEAGDLRAIRDAALVRLMHGAGLRRFEATGLRFPLDLDLDAEDGFAVRPLRKGHAERERKAVGRRAADSLRRWIVARGDFAGPLFVRVDSPKDRTACGALSGEAVRLMLRQRAKEAGCRAVCRPHGLRHAGATEIAKRGSLDQLMAYGGWRTLSAASRYLDELQETRRSALQLVER